MPSQIDKFKMAVAGAQRTNEILAKLYDKYQGTKSLPPQTPFVVGHTLFYGPAGTGKSKSAEEAIKLLNCSEENNSLIRLSCDSIKNTTDLIQILSSLLSWDGYLCDYKKVNHKNCCDCNIRDPKNPRAPIKQSVVYIDEIHNLNKDVQEALLLIMEDFQYQYFNGKNNTSIYFPKFTLIACTTDPGLLIKPLLSRFKLKLKVNRKSDEEMEEVVRSLAAERVLNLDDTAVSLIAKIAQGVPREARNHVEGLYNCWAYLLVNSSNVTNLSQTLITGEVAEYYKTLNNFLEDGTSEDQIRVLRFLNRKTDAGKMITSGLKKIISALGFDEEYYRSFIEPRLEIKGWIDTTRARKLTEEGVEYLNTVLSKDENFGQIN